MKEQNCFSPLIDDIQAQYKRYRTSGKNRAESVAIIESSYATELQDDDDHVAVRIGIALSLSKKKELTNEITAKTLVAIHQARESTVLDAIRSQYLSKIEQLLGDTSLQGKEAVYRQRTPYVPDWKIGDLFSHTLIYPKAKLLGIEGWTILFYKIGECVDELQHCRQLVYVSLCPPGKEPVTSSQLQALGFLRMMNHDDKWDYMAQIVIKSKKDETSYDLTRIGNFQNIILPSDRTDENPLCAMPLFGCLRKGDPWPDYEDQICRMFRKYGRTFD